MSNFISTADQVNIDNQYETVSLNGTVSELSAMSPSTVLGAYGYSITHDKSKTLHSEIQGDIDGTLTNPSVSIAQGREPDGRDQRQINQQSEMEYDDAISIQR